MVVGSEVWGMGWVCDLGWCVYWVEGWVAPVHGCGVWAGLCRLVLSCEFFNYV